MKKQFNTISSHLLPLIICGGIITAFSSPGRNITMWDVVLGVVIGYYIGMMVFKSNVK
jgi:hypothetical protein